MNSALLRFEFQLVWANWGKCFGGGLLESLRKCPILQDAFQGKHICWKFSKSLQTNVLLGLAPPGCKLSQDQPWKMWLEFYPTHNNPRILILHHKQTRENWVCFSSAERRKTRERNLFSLLTSKYSRALQSGLFVFLIYVHDGSCKAFPPHSLDFSRSLVENIIFSNVHQKWIWSYTSYTVVSIWTYTLLS